MADLKTRSSWHATHAFYPQLSPLQFYEINFQRISTVSFFLFVLYSILRLYFPTARDGRCNLFHYTQRKKYLWILTKARWRRISFQKGFQWSIIEHKDFASDRISLSLIREVLGVQCSSASALQTKQGISKRSPKQNISDVSINTYVITLFVLNSFIVCFLTLKNLIKLKNYVSKDEDTCYVIPHRTE
jgi:hypothetical protein